MAVINIDINCDVGEGLQNESALMPYISSCNIACGGHAGDLETMKRVILLAQGNQVKIGAHPGYPDRENFGRKVLDITNQELKDSIKDQLAVFAAAVKQQNAQMHHMKPHGALYNLIADEEDMAHVFLDAVEGYRETPIYLPYLSKIHKAALKRGFRFYLEAFADRNYDANLKLVSRSLDHALIQEPKKVLLHVLTIIQKEEVSTIGNIIRSIKADTICVHGDTPSALKILMYLSKELPKHQVLVSK
ncbi:LamB/YcsF family protein [Croceitalea dokdonensis DOKDO 023]|uniref:LamB/YcsF family protein n=1 Tax=Croceitalea dokdonensis DOKDO 023 TaxID=1300341 RepID=A0A0P7B4D4_9FLAO|nr:5-oxoprolinase subunit PxpA [Croceitalea dokdonensis]KPM33576.1 LamB/YcsF family protein [Croceitalea dokdonensis DOKDO 023]